MKKRIHVNQHHVKANAKDGGDRPVITVKTYKSNDYAHGVVIHGPSSLLYRPNKPLSCGARVWIETDSNVELINRVVRNESLPDDDEDQDLGNPMLDKVGGLSGATSG